MDEKNANVIKFNKNLYTRNLVNNQSVYGEELKKINNVEYRFWDPYRSKLASLLLTGYELPFKDNSTILYLGAGSGTTVSHISDIVKNGEIYAIELSSTPFLKLYRMCNNRLNIYPLLADASMPERYVKFIPEVDFLYQDISQMDQVDILIKNAILFLKKRGIAIFMAKLKSISSVESNESIIERVEEHLNNRFHIKYKVDLSPYEKDHIAYALELK